MILSTQEMNDLKNWLINHYKMEDDYLDFRAQELVYGARLEQIGKLLQMEDKGDDPEKIKQGKEILVYELEQMIAAIKRSLGD